MWTSARRTLRPRSHPGLTYPCRSGPSFAHPIKGPVSMLELASRRICACRTPWRSAAAAERPSVCIALYGRSLITAGPPQLSNSLELADRECPPFVPCPRSWPTQFPLHRRPVRLVDREWVEVLVHENEGNGIPFVVEPNGPDPLARLGVRKNAAGLDLNTATVGSDSVVPGLARIGEFKAEQARRQHLTDLSSDPQRFAGEFTIPPGHCLGGLDRVVKRRELNGFLHLPASTPKR